MCPMLQTCWVCVANVAFNKEATISSRASRHLPGCGVVDGFHGVFKLPLTCVESADYDREPWWTLDLGGVYTIRTVELTWPKEKGRIPSAFDRFTMDRGDLGRLSLSDAK